MLQDKDTRRVRSRWLDRAARDGRSRARRTARCSKASASAPIGEATGEVCFNTAMTGYQEILTDPVLCRPDHHLHLPAYRQCRHQRRGHRDRRTSPRPPACAARAAADVTEPSNYRAAAPSRCLAESPRHRRPHRHRHAGADRAHPRQGHAERGHRARARGQFRHRRALKAKARGLPRPGRPRPRAAGHQRASATTGTRRTWARGEGYGHQDGATSIVVAIDYGVKRNILRLSGRRRLQGHGGARHHHGRGHAGAQARRRVPVQRPRRSGRDRRICGAGDPQAARPEDPDLRHLPRPPDAGPRRRRARPRRCTRATTAPTIR